MDITYIPLASGFVYLVLDEAIGRFGTPEIFNIDLGSQFTSQPFTRVLQDQEFASA